jgi:peptidyl-prolyl cis-trans isomerase C
MSQYLRILIAVALITGIASCGGNNGKVLVRVGNATITDGDLNLLVKVNPRLQERLATPVGRQKIIDNFVDQSLLYQESKRRGLDKKDVVKDKVELYTKVIISQALLEEELEKNIKDYYDNHQDEFERVKVAQIYVPFRTSDKENKATRSEVRAQAIIDAIKDRIGKGENFGKLATELSEDDRSKRLGGDLGYVTVSDQRLTRKGWSALAEKAFALKSGEVSDVIKTSNGFHIIKILEPKATEPFEQAEKRVRFRIQSQAKEDLLSELKKKYKVVYVENAADEKKAPAALSTPPPSGAPSDKPVEAAPKAETPPAKVEE